MTKDDARDRIMEAADQLGALESDDGGYMPREIIISNCTPALEVIGEMGSVETKRQWSEKRSRLEESDMARAQINGVYFLVFGVSREVGA